MMYHGALEQLIHLLWVGVAISVGWLIHSGLRKATHPRVVEVRKSVVEVMRFVLPWAWLAVLKDADSKGTERARKFAMSAENQTDRLVTVIRRKVADEVITVEGLQLGCSERFCALYLPGVTKTGADSKTAAGTTLLVPLDNLLSITISAKAQARGNKPASASSSVK